MSRAGQEWTPVGVDSFLERGPTAQPLVTIPRGGLTLLPFEELSWPDFESLQWRILRDLEGLRHAYLYGDPGQKQLGIDLLATAPDDSFVAMQSKRVKSFGPQSITAAVNAFRTTKRPFQVNRFIIGVSRTVRTTAARDRLIKLQKELKPVELELWDQEELSERLKTAPEIVIEYFGNAVAEAFCLPFTISHRVVPRRDMVALRQAIARTPEETTGAGLKISAAEARAEDAPELALQLVEQAQNALVDAGFAGHAARHDTLRARLLVGAGRGDEASRRRLEQLWTALEQGQSTSADIANHDISALAREVDSDEIRTHESVAQTAVHLYANPLASTPDITSLMIGSDLDRARLTALAGETALCAADIDWLKTNAPKLRKLAGRLPMQAEHDALRVRLKILAAEGSGSWATILGEARQLKISYALAGLVKARHARHLALAQKFREADAEWDEATGDACLAEHWTDAARWTFSRRAFRIRWAPFTSDQLLPIQTALSTRGPDTTVLPRDEDALEYAYGSLAEDKPRAAAIAAQRALRDAVSLSDWEGERRARRLLAEVLLASGEPEAAAAHLVTAGDTARLKQLGAETDTPFVDVTPLLDAVPWWIAGAAYRMLATQSDLVPDTAVDWIADHVIAELNAAKETSLIDLPGFAGSRFLGAIAAIAGLSERLNGHQAEAVMSFFEGQPPVGPGQYRFHDEDEAVTIAGILTTHPTLLERGLAHLVALLARSDGSRKLRTREAVEDHFDLARPLLDQLAAGGNRWAREWLDSKSPNEAPAQRIQEARARLEEPLASTPGVYEVGAGSSAFPDAILVRELPVVDQQAALKQLLERGSHPDVSAPDRASYMIAASNLRPPQARAERRELLDRAIELVFSEPKSPADELNQLYQHPLGAMRLPAPRSSRAEAAYLAAGLATNQADRERVRTATVGLIGDKSVSTYWVTRALQRLGDTMLPDVGFLSGQDWALKSLAAILWSRTTIPSPVGFRLAADPDVRVRRALATHLSESQEREAIGDSGLWTNGTIHTSARISARRELLDALSRDSSFSVRKAASATRGVASTASPANR